MQKSSSIHLLDKTIGMQIYNSKNERRSSDPVQSCSPSKNPLASLPSRQENSNFEVAACGKRHQISQDMHGDDSSLHFAKRFCSFNQWYNRRRLMAELQNNNKRMHGDSPYAKSLSSVLKKSRQTDLTDTEVSVYNKQNEDKNTLIDHQVNQANDVWNFIGIG
jgi:hypothetical protein